MKRLRFSVVSPLGECKVTLYQRPDSPRYWAWFTWRKVSYRESTGRTNPKDARAVAEDRVRAVMGAPTQTAPTVTLAVAAGEMLSEMARTHSASHVQTLSAIIAAFGRLHGDEPVSGLAFARARVMVGEYLASLRYAPLTVRNHRVGLSRFFGYLIRRGLVDWPSNPAAGQLHALPPVTHRIPAMPQDEDVDRLLAAARETVWYPALVLLLSGCRPASVGRVTWGDLAAGRLVVTEKNRQRVVVLSAWAARELETRRGPSGDPISPLHQDTVTHRLQGVREALGLPDTLTLAGLRRYTDQRLYAAGVPAAHAAQVLGHSPTTSERHYLDWRSLSGTQAAAALDRAAPSVQKSCGKREARTSESPRVSGPEPAPTL